MKKRLKNVIIMMVGGIALLSYKPVNLCAAEVEDSGFFYEEELEDGTQIIITAEDGVLPDGAMVEIDKVNSLNELSDIEDMEERTIYDMYENVEIISQTSDTYCISIYYMNEEGQMAEVQSMEGINIACELSQPVSDNVKKTVVSENLVYDEGFQYNVEIASYSATADDETLAAMRKAWDIIDKYVDVEYIETEWYETTDAEYAVLKAVVDEAIADCTTQYEKIEALNKCVAENIYYDYAYYYGVTQTTYVTPYEVWSNKRSVCQGYAELYKALLEIAGIPCLEIYGDDHVYNFVYDSDQDRWIFVDSTWCSGNMYTSDGEWIEGSYSDWCFDVSVEDVALLSNHEVYGINGILSHENDNVYYSLYTGFYDGEDWTDTSKWYLELAQLKSGTDIVVKDNFSDLDIKNIGEYAFFEADAIKTIDLSDSDIEYIKYAAFGYCSSLETVKLPKTIKEIESFAFYQCTSLESINLSGSELETIGYGAFYDCESLTDLDLTETSIAQIGEYAFANCSNIKTLDLSVVNDVIIGNCAFYYCDSLAEAKFPVGDVIIADYAFCYCFDLEEITIPSTSISCGESVFDTYYTRVPTKVITDLSYEDIGYDAGEAGIWGMRDVTIVPLTKNGWIKDEGKWYYYEMTDIFSVGWKKIDKIWYFFDTSGVMQTGWEKVNGVWYYFSGSGAMQTGWKKISGVWYYFNGSGAMQTGWEKVNGIWYYFDGNGAMQTGWEKVNGVWYYFDGNGAMQTGWKKISGKWYYFNESGAMQTGWLKDNGKWYCLGGSGAMLTGAYNINGVTYKFNNSGEWIE